MFLSLQTINNLPDKTIVYCGHEYTYQNYNFLCSIFVNYETLESYKEKIDKRFNSNNNLVSLTSFFNFLKAFSILLFITFI